VDGYPARGVVELARLVQRGIEGVFVLFAPLTAIGSPRASLVSSRSLRAGGALGKRLLEAQPQVDMKRQLAHVRVSRLAGLTS
jgi:hypothetical protein